MQASFAEGRRTGDLYFVFKDISDYRTYLPMYQNIALLPTKINAGIGMQLTPHSSLELALRGYVAMHDSAILAQAGATCSTSDHCLLVDLNAV